MSKVANGDAGLLAVMNDELNPLIESQAGDDIGQMMPDDPESNWELYPSGRQMHV